jgi:hypothetical protein
MTTQHIAAQLGIPRAEVEEHLSAGEKWCVGCKKWQPRTEFGRDASRPDGLATTCIVFRRAAYKKKTDQIERKPRVYQRGGSRVLARAGDKMQARRRVNYLVESGLIPNPNDLPCVDCNHKGPERRHEYDHFMGYLPEYHETVESVCSRCHKKRTWKQKKSS